MLEREESVVMYNGIDSKEQRKFSNFTFAKLNLWKYKKNYESVFIQSNKLASFPLLSTSEVLGNTGREAAYCASWWKAF